MKNTKYQIAIAFVCVVLGLMVSIQFRTVKQGVGPVSEYRLIILNGILEIGKHTTVIVSGKKIKRMKLLNIQH